MQWLRCNRAGIAALAAGAVVVALHSRIPVLVYLFPFVLAVVVLASRVAALSGGERLWILACCAGSLLFGICAPAAFGIHDPLKACEHLDDYSYFLAGGEIAKAWKSGFYPALSLKGSPPYLGSLHTGYERALALLFILFGARVSVGIALNIFCSAVMPAIGYLLAESLFDKGVTTPQRVPRAAALMCAAYPGYVYWSSWLLKDVLLAMTFALCLLFATDGFKEIGR